MALTHLHPSAREVLDLPTQERIRCIQSSAWIQYPAASAALNRMEELLAQPRRARMPSLLIVADSNGGKTSILRRFVSLHPYLEEDDGIEAPVVLIEAPSQADEKRIFASIVEALYGPMRRWARVDQLEYEATTLLRETKTKLLLIDEVQHLLTGALIRRQACLQALKSLSNKLGISIVAAGLPEAFSAINSDAQMSNRFERIVLERWQPTAEFKQLLRTFETVLPLRRPSCLTDAAIASKILTCSEGLLGEICDLLSKAALYAIKSGTECIDLKSLDSCGYIPPADRVVYDRYLAMRH